MSEEEKNFCLEVIAYYFDIHRDYTEAIYWANKLYVEIDGLISSAHFSYYVEEFL